jgi:hypothetical protein
MCASRREIFKRNLEMDRKRIMRDLLQQIDEQCSIS